MPNFAKEVNKLEQEIRQRGYDKKAEDEMKRRWERLRSKKGIKA